MPLNFEKHAQKGNQFLNELSKELGENYTKARSGKILRAVFKTLRGHLTLEENFQLLSQLPMALKALYVDTWMPTRKPDIGRKKIDFIQEVLAYEDKDLWPRAEDFENTLKEVKAVFKTLRKHVSEGEFKDVEAILPRQLKELLRAGTHPGRITIKRITEKAI